MINEANRAVFRSSGDDATRLPTVLMVPIRALKRSFYVDGRTVVEGQVYTVPVDIAEGLAYVGKAVRIGWNEM
jgi:hypothetical protein